MNPIKIPGTNKTIGGTDIFVAVDIGKNFIQTQEEQPTSVYLKNAKDLIDAAVDAGVDAIKFQTHTVEDEQLNVHIVSPHFKGSDRYNWVKRNTESTPLSFWRELKEYTESKGVIFFSTPMSRGSAYKLEEIGVPLWKVGSGDVQDNVMLDFLCATHKPVIIATGMVSLKELEDVVHFVTSRGTPLTILYCISKYPCPTEDFNLSTIEYFKEKYPQCAVGFSDHSIGFEVDLAAAKLGAQMIEKHFSFDRGLWGADHKVSMTPQETKDMVKALRSGEYKDVDVAKFYGEKTKELEGAGNQFRPYFNKSLVVGVDAPAGAIITKEMVYAMRPRMYCEGLHSEEYEKVLGKRLKKDLKKYDPLNADTVEL